MKKLLCIAVVLTAVLCTAACSKQGPVRETVYLGIPDSETVRDFKSNYYINWLEEATDCDIEVVPIIQNRCEDFLNSLETSEINIDAILFGSDFTLSYEELREFAIEGRLVGLDGFIGPDTPAILSEAVYSIDSTGGRRLEGIYCFPKIGTDSGDGCGQTMWINTQWLINLGLEVPRTTDELEQVLRAFAERDPNRNGMHDEIAFMGSTGGYMYNPSEFLLNAFIYNDPWNSRFCMTDGRRVFAPTTDEFRQGLEYCAELYAEGLISPRCYTYTIDQMVELINSSGDYVGAFTTDSLANVIFQSNPEIMARFLHVPPLEGIPGTRNALYVKQVADIGAVIPAAAANPRGAFKVLSTMLTNEASLIARFGEENADWKYSDGSDVSLYGGTAEIVTINNIWGTVQNKHLNGIGPMNVRDDYLKGVIWNGADSDTEYVDTRASLSYRPFFPKESAGVGYVGPIVGFVDEAIGEFIRGERDIGSDDEWEEFVNICKILTAGVTGQ